MQLCVPNAVDLASRLCICHPDTANSGAFLSFSGDADDEHHGEDVAVDLFAEAQKAADELDAAEEEEDDEAEPEDDFNAAWEVLDLARAIYEKQQDESDEVKLKLADTYITLGDVSLETGTSASFWILVHVTHGQQL